MSLSRRPWLIFGLFAIFLLGACTMRSAIDAMSSPEDRAFANQMVERLRSGDSEWLRGHFDEALWEESAKQLGQVPAMFPGQAGTTELVGFNVSTNMAGGATERSKEYTLVTEGEGRWTVTTFRTHSNGGPDRVVQWRVVPHNSQPPELAMIRGFDAAIPWVWGALAVIAAMAAALIVWLVRRSRRKRA